GNSFIHTMKQINPTTRFPYTTLFRSSESHRRHPQRQPVEPAQQLLHGLAEARELCSHRGRRLSPPLLSEQACQSIQDHARGARRSEEHTSELQSRSEIVCRLPLEKKK